jgi:hypothetical protein
MRLVDLEPRWLIKDGQRVGFIFRSPTRPQCWQSCFFKSPPRREQWAMFAETLKSDDPDDLTMGRHDVQGAREGTTWSIAGEFENLTVTPSIDGSPGGNWHGFITNGQIVGGL